MKSHLFSRPFRLDAVWLLAPIVGVIAAASLSPIPPYDYWWHLVMGRFIASNLAVPDTNLFLYTMAPDAPFFNQPWLGQLLMFWGFSAGGPEATILMRNVLVGLSFGLVSKIAYDRQASPRAIGALGLVFAVSTFPVLTVRTRMFAFVPYAMLLWWVVRYATGRGRWRDVVIASVGVVFWANTHGSFVLAPLIAFGITGCVGLQLLVEEGRLRWDPLKMGVGATVAFSMAGMLTPFGPAVYAYVAHLALTSTVSSTVTEWRPPDVNDPIGVFFLFAVALASGFLAWRRREAKIWEAGLLLVTTYLAASAVRSIFFWAPAVIVVLAPHLSAIWKESSAPSESQGRLNLVLAGLVVLALIFMQPGLGREGLVASSHGEIRRVEPGRAVFSAETPLTALERIAPEKRIFHHQSIGGLIEYSRTEPESPMPVAFVDQRMELIPDPVWTTYFGISAAEGEWEAELSTYDVDVLILHPKTQWRLIQEALKSPQWRWGGYDEYFVVFQRAKP